MTDVKIAHERVRVQAARKRRRARIYYTAGPGGLIGAYQHWRDGNITTDVAVTYSGQFFDVCRKLDAEVYAVASSPDYPRSEELHDGVYHIRQRRCPWETWRGPMFHLGDLVGSLGHIVSALRHGADVVVLHGGYSHYYLYSALRLFGIEIVPVLMTVLWPKYKPLGRGKRALKRLNGWFFRHSAGAIVSMSEDCSRQIREMTDGRSAAIEPFIPKFCSDLFEDLPPPAPAPPFRVLYVGRIERYKGVFDLLEIAKRFDSEGRTDIEFDLCGAGPMFDELRGDVERAGLADRFRLHGHCDQKSLLRMYGASHVVVVPTRAEFPEGFNQVLAEAVISGKPVVTSSVCPALEVVKVAAVEVPPDDVEAYGNAILRLYEDSALYAEKKNACPTVRDKFLGSDLTFDHVMERILEAILARRRLIDPRP